MSKRSRTNWREARLYFAVAGAGVLLGYLVVALFVFPATPVSQPLPVPDVVGATFDSASVLLRKAGFTPEQGQNQDVKTATTRTVVRQEPEGGAKHPAGTKVTLHTSGAAK